VSTSFGQLRGQPCNHTFLIVNVFNKSHDSGFMHTISTLPVVLASTGAVMQVSERVVNQLLTEMDGLDERKQASLNCLNCSCGLLGENEIDESNRVL
jgi:hypothetical protein